MVLRLEGTWKLGKLDDEKHINDVCHSYRSDDISFVVIVCSGGGNIEAASLKVCQKSYYYYYYYYYYCHRRGIYYLIFRVF